MKKNAFGNIEIMDAEIAVKCIICDNYIPITQREADSIHIKVCDECKTSIKWAKERMKEQEAVIEQYHKADTFLEAHGGKLEGR